MHIGNIGLAPGLGAATSTAPPYRTGGNLDNKRIGIGGKLSLPALICSQYCLRDDSVMIQGLMSMAVLRDAHGGVAL